ncbi:Acetyl-coenzyme A synthetase [Streptomyces violaceorubidus]
MSNESLANLLKEERRFAPPADLAANANVTAEAYERAKADRLGFWAEQARRLTWAQEPTETLDWSNPPFAKWFKDGTLNVAYNCVDRHVEAGHGDRVAIHFEGEPGDSRALTYAQLKDEVSKAANALLELGVRKGDRVAVYMPMIPETAIAMLACARIGAAHSVVFGGFSSDALATRIQDADARVVITADGGYRRGKPSALKPAVDEAAERAGTVEHVLVVRRTGQDVAWDDTRDKWWHETVDRQSPEHTPEAFDAEHPLFILYTSGTTGKPKGILHTSGGYLTQTAYTHWAVFDLKPETDVFWLHRRRRLGHRTLVHRLRPARQRRDAGHVRGHPGHPAPGPVLGDRAEIRRDDPVHGADRDPDVHEVGRRHPREVRPVLPARPRLGGRADQPRGVDLVPQEHRRRHHPRRRHLVGRPRPAR